MRNNVDEGGLCKNSMEIKVSSMEDLERKRKKEAWRRRRRRRRGSCRGFVPAEGGIFKSFSHLITFN